MKKYSIEGKYKQGCSISKDLEIKIELIKNKTKVRGLIVIFRLKGLFSTLNHEDIISFLDARAYYPHCFYIIDCSGLIKDYISYAHQNDFTKRFAKTSGSVVLTGLTQDIYDFIQRSGISQFINISDTIELAIEKYADNYFILKNGIKELPQELYCPICSSKLLIKRFGKMKCKNCKTIMILDDRGKLRLG